MNGHDSCVAEMNRLELANAELRKRVGELEAELAAALEKKARKRRPRPALRFVDDPFDSQFVCRDCIPASGISAGVKCPKHRDGAT